MVVPTQDLIRIDTTNGNETEVAQNADERVHVDDLVLAARFHVALAKRVLG